MPYGLKQEIHILEQSFWVLKAFKNIKQIGKDSQGIFHEAVYNNAVKSLEKYQARYDTLEQVISRKDQEMENRLIESWSEWRDRSINETQLAERQMIAAWILMTNLQALRDQLHKVYVEIEEAKHIVRSYKKRDKEYRGWGKERNSLLNELRRYRYCSDKEGAHFVAIYESSVKNLQERIKKIDVLILEAMQREVDENFNKILSSEMGSVWWNIVLSLDKLCFLREEILSRGEEKMTFDRAQRLWAEQKYDYQPQAQGSEASVGKYREQLDVLVRELSKFCTVFELPAEIELHRHQLEAILEMAKEEQSRFNGEEVVSQGIRAEL